MEPLSPFTQTVAAQFRTLVLTLLSENAANFISNQNISRSITFGKHRFRLVKKDDMRNTISTRLLGYTYTFGEFVCQGSLVHNRHCDKANGPMSHIISLAALRRNGLPVLYPELEDPSGHAKWALTTIALRKIWHGDEHGELSRCQTTSEELQAAVDLAVMWFKPPFDPLKLAIYLLSFKRCELNYSQMESERVLQRPEETWARHPVDVREFALATKVVDQVYQNDRADSPMVPHKKDFFGHAFSSRDPAIHRVMQVLLRSHIS